MSHEICVYPDMEIYHYPPEWKSDDYYTVNGETTMGELLGRFSPEEAKQIVYEYLNNTEE